MIGITNAPPETPIIINAEISLARSGLCCKAEAKSIEKTLAQAKPIIVIIANNTHKLFINNNSRKQTIAPAIVYFKNLIDE